MVKVQNSIGQLLFLESKIEIIFTSRGSMVTKVEWAQLLGEKSKWHSSLGASNVLTMGSCNFRKMPTHLHI